MAALTTSVEKALLHHLFSRLATLQDHAIESVDSRLHIISYAVTSTEVTIPAYNEYTEMSNLQTAKWVLCGPMWYPMKQYHEAEKIFWEQNIIFVRSLQSVSKDLTVSFEDQVKKLWVNVDVGMAKMGATALQAHFSKALKGCESLEMLIVAVVSKSAAAMKRVLVRDLQTFVDAVGALAISKKLILLCTEEMHVEEREDVVVRARSRARQGGVAFAV